MLIAHSWEKRAEHKHNVETCGEWGAAPPQHSPQITHIAKNSEEKLNKK